MTEDINLTYAWMLAAKDAGDLQAQEAVKRMADEMHGRIYFSEFKLADLYEQGVEIPKDLSRAADLYRTQLPRLPLIQRESDR